MSDGPTTAVDADLAPFQEGLEQGELRVQSCLACGAVRWPPRPACPRCRSLDSAWRPVEPRGTVYSWVVLHHSAVESVRERLPLPVAIVELQEGVRMIGGLDCPVDAVAIGQPVQASFGRNADGEVLVTWAPV